MSKPAELRHDSGVRGCKTLANVRLRLGRLFVGMQDHLNNARLQLLHRRLLFGLHRGTHHLPLHHAVLVQGSLVLVEDALLVALAEVLQGNTGITTAA